MPSLLDNKLLIQYLSAAGQDIQAGNPLGANVHGVTNQAIAAQNYSKLLQQLLSGGGKVTMDGQNVSIKAPNTAFQGPGGPGTASPLAMPQENIGLRGQGGTAGVSNKINQVTPTPSPARAQENDAVTSLLSQLLGGNTGTPNPSSSPLGDISPSDLAGLTPQDISQALQFKFAQQAQGRESVNDLINNMYKLSLMDQGAASNEIARLKELRQWEQLMQQAPLEAPGLGRLSLDVWEKLPTDVKAYSYYAFNAKQNGEKVLSYNEFKQQADPSSLIQYYELSKTDPEFAKWAKTWNESKASKNIVNIGQASDKKTALNWVDFRSSMKESVDKYVASDAVQDSVMEFYGTPQYGTALAIKKSDFIEQKLRDNKVKIISKNLNKTTGIATWIVETPTGERETLTYDLNG